MDYFHIASIFTHGQGLCTGTKIIGGPHIWENEILIFILRYHLVFYRCDHESGGNSRKTENTDIMCINS